MDSYERAAYLRLAAHAESLRERFPDREAVLTRIAHEARIRLGSSPTLTNPGRHIGRIEPQAQQYVTCNPSWVP